MGAQEAQERERAAVQRRRAAAHDGRRRPSGAAGVQHGTTAASSKAARRALRMIAAPMAPDDSLAERLLAGDKRALARAISLVEDDDPAGWELVREVYPQHRPGRGRRLHRPARAPASRR